MAMTFPDKPRSYAIEKLVDGGFVVRDAWMRGDHMDSLLFASTTIQEALAFIRQKLDPPKASA